MVGGSEGSNESIEVCFVRQFRGIYRCIRLAMDTCTLRCIDAQILVCLRETGVCDSRRGKEQELLLSVGL